jgi:hypothetical protein
MSDCGAHIVAAIAPLLRNALQALNNMIIALSRGATAIFRGGMALPSARKDFNNNNGDFAR